MNKITISLFACILLITTSDFANAQTVTTKFKCYMLSPDMDLSKSDKVTVGETKIGSRRRTAGVSGQSGGLSYFSADIEQSGGGWNSAAAALFG